MLYDQDDARTSAAEYALSAFLYHVERSANDRLGEWSLSWASAECWADAYMEIEGRREG